MRVRFLLLVVPVVVLLAACTDVRTEHIDDALGDTAGDAAGDVGEVPMEPVVVERASFEEPAPVFRPWVRWWWPGNDVDDNELEREIDLLADNFFGGAEIQAFDAALEREPEEDAYTRRMSVDSDSYYAHVAVALDAARDRGLLIDLNQGSGWPAGGTNIAVEDSLKTLVWGETQVEGPGEVSETLAPDQSPFYVAAEAVVAMGEKLTRWLPEHATFVGAIAAKVTGGARAISPLDLTDSLELDAGSVVDVSDFVDAELKLTWQAPAGTWQVISYYQMPDGQYLSLPALPDPDDGFVADHLNADEVLANLEHWMGARTGLESYYGDPLRGLFNDSFEWKVELLFADDMADEFEARRGYPLLPSLPAVLVPGADNFVFEAGRVGRAAEFVFGEDDERIRRDYRDTVTDLFVERFMDTTASWAEDRGLTSRVQGYGVDVDVIRVAGAAHIPETEQLYAGGAEMFSRIASSGAHLYGRNLVSSETFVWMGRDFMTTPLKMKIAADKLFGSGVNQLIYHGFPYRHEGDFGVIGWTAFSSRYGGANTYGSTFAEPFEFFDTLPAFNRYVARCQHLLRQGEPEVDFLVYYPHIGFPTSLPLEEGVYELLLGGYLDGAEPEMRGTAFDTLLALLGDPVSDPRSLWMIALMPLLEDLESKGFTWDWVNDESLAVAQADGEGGIDVRGAQYRALVIADCPKMSPEAAAAAEALGAAGVPVGLFGSTPSTAHGFAEAETNDAAVAASMAALAQASNVFTDIGDLDAVGLASRMNAEGADAWRFLYRDMGEGFVAFVRDVGGAAAEATLGFSESCATLDLLDPWTGAICRLDDASLSLDAYGSAFVACGVQMDEEPPACAASPAFDTAELTDWEFVLENPEGNDGLVVLETDGFGDWRDIEELKYAGGPGVYTTTIAKPAAARVQLELSALHGAAEVVVNGNSAGWALVPPYRVDVTEMLVDGDNEIELVVTPPLRNYLVGRAIEGDERYVQFTGKEDTLVSSGLEGPVLLRTVAE